jgi:hypothetical protein
MLLTFKEKDLSGEGREHIPTVMEYVGIPLDFSDQVT